MQDWTGNKNSVYKTLGASNHTNKEMQRTSINIVLMCVIRCCTLYGGIKA